MGNEIEKPTIERRGSTTTLVFSDNKKLYLFLYSEIASKLGIEFIRKIQGGDIWISALDGRLSLNTRDYDEFFEPIIKPLLQ